MTGSDVVIVQNNPLSVLYLIRISQKTMSNIYQNIFMAIAFKVVFFVLSVLGYSKLWMAIFADTGATVLVTLNAMRLLLSKVEKADKT